MGENAPRYDGEHPDRTKGLVSAPSTDTPRPCRPHCPAGAVWHVVCAASLLDIVAKRTDVPRSR